MSRDGDILRDDLDSKSQWYEDVIVLLDGFWEEFGCTSPKCGYNFPNWYEFTKEQKREWIEEFAVEHAHPIDVSQLSEESVAFLESWQEVYARWKKEQIERLRVAKKELQVEQCLEQLHLTGREKQTLLGCISIAIEEGLYKDSIDEESVKHILVNLGVSLEDVNNAIYYCDPYKIENGGESE